MKRVDKFIEWAKTKPNVRIGRKDDDYMTRYYIFNSWLFGIYLHDFHRPDVDTDLHNHPWLFAFSIVLKGWYIEKLLTRNLQLVTHRWCNFIWGSNFHLIQDAHPELHTLFIRGPRVRKWGFLRAQRGELVFDVFKSRKWDEKK